MINLRRANDNVVKRVLNFEIIGERRRERPKMIWRRQVEKRLKRLYYRSMLSTEISGVMLFVKFRGL